MLTKFELTAEQTDRLDIWLKEEVYPTVIERQKKLAEESGKSANPIEKYDWASGYPYEGAIGGGLTYHFTPTSIGVVQKVTYENGLSKFELDLSDYESW